MLKDSIERLIGERYQFEQRRRLSRLRRWLQPRAVADLCRHGPARPALRRKRRRTGRRPCRHDDHHGSARTRLDAGAVSRDRRTRRRTAACSGQYATTRNHSFPRSSRGELLLAFAHSEAQSRYDLADVQTTAQRDGAGWILNGSKRFVLNGDSADKLIVSARAAGNRSDRDGLALFLIDAKPKA